MPSYYHLDRRNGFVNGAEARLVCHQDIQPTPLQEHLDALFPNGVTEHGRQYLVQAQVIAAQEPALELLFEYVRRASFPDRPSRFQSLFGFGSLGDALRFRNDMNAERARIWRVEVSDAFRADMNYLKLVGASALTVSYFAHRYWSGSSSSPESSPEPRWEYLLRPAAVTRMTPIR
jgi:hypothetical protein